MHNKHVPGFMTALVLVLTGCGGGVSSDGSHGEPPNIAITADNALAIATKVYRVAAVDVPHTAALAMNPGSLTQINPAACNGGTVSSDSSSGMMGMGMMDMRFTNCQLATTPLNSAHTLIVNGTCSNSVSSMSNTVETVIGSEIRFTASGESMRLHAFSITRDSDNMTSAQGVLHDVDGEGYMNVVTFNTPTAFSGTAGAPMVGVLLVNGLNNSRLRLTIVNGGVDFTLEVDADGDDRYEYLQTQNWNNIFWSLIP